MSGHTREHVWTCPIAGYLFLGGLGAGMTLVAAMGNALAFALASLLLVIGGLFLRFLVVYSDDRRMFDGEELWRSQLPRGDEDFLKSTWE